DYLEPGVVAVDGLGPRGDGPAGRDLEHVGCEAAVGQAQVERGGAGVTFEVEVRDLGRLDVFGKRVGDSLLDERLIAERAVVRPGGRDDPVAQRVRALG